MSAQATDPRDYLNAKLGLASDGHFVVPDYAKVVVEAYRDFVSEHIRATQLLDIIYFDARPWETAGLPSRVPDWNASLGAHHLVFEEGTSLGHGISPALMNVLQNRSGDPVATFDFGVEGVHRLVVNGCFVDKVDRVSQAGEMRRQGTEAARPMSQPEYPSSAHGADEDNFDAV